MPEGPSIVILREAVSAFKRKKLVSAEGSAKIDMKRLAGLTVLDFKSWGKHFLICFKDCFIRIHLLMFGTYSINDEKDAEPRLKLSFAKGEINFYTCSVKLIEGDPNDVYDWETDIMSDQWNEKKAGEAMKKMKDQQVCDVLLNQDVFSGVGNIIKNEVLFRTRIHPESRIGTIPTRKVKEMVKDARTYSFDFYKWKKLFELRQHWLVYKKSTCPRCNIPVKTDHLGKTKRLSFFCTNCQILFQK